MPTADASTQTPRAWGSDRATYLPLPSTYKEGMVKDGMVVKHRLFIKLTEPKAMRVEKRLVPAGSTATSSGASATLSPPSS